MSSRNMELALDRTDLPEMDCGRELKRVDGGCSSSSLLLLRPDWPFSERPRPLLLEAEPRPGLR